MSRWTRDKKQRAIERSRIVFQITQPCRDYEMFRVRLNMQRNYLAGKSLTGFFNPDGTVWLTNREFIDIPLTWVGIRRKR